MEERLRKMERQDSHNVIDCICESGDLDVSYVILMSF